MQKISERIKTMSADEIKCCLSRDHSDDEYTRSDNISFKLCDAASLFVMTAYLNELPEEKHR